MQHRRRKGEIEMKTVRLGSATGWARDRFNHAQDLVSNGNLNYICFETMSEITMSATLSNNADDKNAILYDPYLEKRLRPILKECVDKGIKIISNAGWADPRGAAEKVAEMAKALGIKKLKIAAVYNTKDKELQAKISDMGLTFTENGEEVSKYRDKIVSIDAYLGADGILTALKQGANVVITTRIVDSALYLGPLAYEFGWDLENIETTAKGSIVGHLMECGSHLCGGFFADPGYKEVPDLAHLGNPIAEVSEDHVYLTKTSTTGGVMSTETCKEQLVYEITDPSTYILPNVVIDFRQLKFTQAGKDKVEVTGFAGRKKPEKLKVLVGMREGFATEEMVLFAGPDALKRAEMTKGILLERFDIIGFHPKELRINYVGLNAIHREATPPANFEPYEVILRIAAKSDSREECSLLRQEIDPISMNGPTATGKYGSMSGRIRSVIGMYSTLVARDCVDEQIAYYEV